MNQNAMQIIISKNGVPIRLTYKQWMHIIENHNYMAGNLDIIIETIADPDYIVTGKNNELTAIKHYNKTVITEKDAIVVYKEINNNDGFVVTAWLTSKRDKILKRGIIWQK
ncbi:MAG TPA: hypothetical protein V6C58_07200, partial [Allocoleopsis sp.]